MSVRSAIRLSFIGLLTALLALCLTLPSQVSAQDVASLTGVVTDSTGAVVVDAGVKLVDTKTNSSYETKTNAPGAYTFTNLPPGPGYTLTVTKEGFDKVVISKLYLAVNTTHTQNAQLTVGKTTETVEVSALGSAVSLNTTDSSIGNSFDMSMVHNLPVQARDNPTELMVYQPGVVTAAGGNENGNQSRDGATTGARTDQGNVTVDGLDANDFAGGFAFNITGNAPVDSIQEFHGETANPLAAEGRGSGAQYNLVTKSGTNSWHGSASEYHRNTVTEANDFFNNLAGVQRPQLIRNQFDTAIGGPIKKDKLFFFFNYEGERTASESTPTRTVPSDTLRQGEIQYPNTSGGISTASMSDLAALDPGTDPNTGQPGVNSALLGFLNSRYPTANTASPGSDSLNTGGFRFNAPVHFTENNYLARVDYNLTSKMKLWGKFSIVRTTTGDNVNFSAPFVFPGDPLTHLITDKSWDYVFGHTWTIGTTKVNQFIYGQKRQVLGFPTPYNPTGTTQYSSFGSDGVGGALLTSPYSNGASQARTVPIPVYRDDFNWMRGKHNMQFGGTFKNITTTATLVSDFNSVNIGLGGGRTSLDTAPPEASLRPSDLAGDGASVQLWDTAFTFMLGRFANVSSNFNNNAQLQPLPQGTGHTRKYRYYETELYAQDSWKATSNLTLTYGLRYQLYSVPYEINGLEAIPTTGFNDIINPRIANGAQGIPGTATNPTAPNTAYIMGGKANHGPGFYSPQHHDFAPRFSFAYNPSARDGWFGRLFGERKTVIRGGAGLVYDHPGINALNFFQDQFTYVLQNVSAIPYGTTGDAINDLINDPRFTAVGALPSGAPAPPPPVSVPFEPFVDPTFGPFGTASNQGLFNYAIDPHLKTPYSEVFTLGIQRELPGNFLLDVSYFNRSGHRLLAQSDAGQVIDYKDTTTGTGFAPGQFLAPAFGNMANEFRSGVPTPSLTPQPFFENQMQAALDANYGTGAFTCETYLLALTNGGIDEPTCTSVARVVSGRGLVTRGDLGDSVQALDFFNLLLPGVGLAPQFASDIYMNNKGYSNYNGLLATLHKKYSHGLQFDLNYTYSHSIDNMSAAANSAFGANGAGGILCDAINLRTCRANSDFDATHNITADWIYDLPLGRGRAFGKDMSRWMDEIVGGWQISGLASWRTGFAFTTVANSFPISFANNVPAMFNGDRSALRTNPHLDPATGEVQLFANPDAAVGAFSYPTGLQAGSRNNLRGPHYSNFNLGLGKNFPINEKTKLQFRADAFNVFNHTNFTLPGSSGTADISLPYATGGNFGVISSDAGPRVMQFSLRLEF
ncbi:MAG: TonB-dependent receptor [Acidobacteriia bacterium]|nr:TonB-dependent receptor [Terriglobia bacterium]